MPLIVGNCLSLTTTYNMVDVIMLSVYLHVLINRHLLLLPLDKKKWLKTCGLNLVKNCNLENSLTLFCYKTCSCRDHLLWTTLKLLPVDNINDDDNMDNTVIAMISWIWTVHLFMDSRSTLNAECLPISIRWFFLQ